MAGLARVVWSEGMHLAQHHFQAQTRYFEELASFAVQTLFFEPWGLTACDLDAEALLNGTVSVTHASGIMPDGLAFSFPDDTPPPPLELAPIFSPTQDAEIVRLGIPVYRPGAANAGADGRFSAETVRVPDEVTGDEPRAVGVAHKNFRLLLGDAPAEGLTTLPLTRVRRDGSGHFIFDPEYVPPVLHLGASPRLLTLLARLLDVLDAKADSLRAERQAAAASAGAGYASHEISAFWLSHALHSSIPTLRQLQELRAAHPEELYRELARLAGALCTFSLASDPRALPLYDHNDLGGCFGALERHILQHLEVVLPSAGTTLPLRRTADFYFAAAVQDARCFSAARWFLGVRAQATLPQIAERVPQLVKVCSAKHIERLVREARPALGLDPIGTPPAGISPRFDTQYFLLQQAGPCWTLIGETHEIGVYVPDAIPGAELDLCILLEE
ncbi:MAG TPA: type VI secretion system baseplate subunit TssK [Longimicrobiales bacterium]